MRHIFDMDMDMEQKDSLKSRTWTQGYDENIYHNKERVHYIETCPCIQKSTHICLII